jgi:iron complex outermembrane recepter protein
LDVNLRWRYFGSDESEDVSSSPLLHVTAPFLPLSHISAYNYLDLAATFDLYKGLKLELAVNNIMDKDPPRGVTSSSTSQRGSNFPPLRV